MTLRGNLETVSPTAITGWAWESDAPNAPVSLVISVDDVVFGRCLADLYRKGLADRGIGAGRHAFAFRPSPPLSLLTRHVVSVRREGDGAHVPQSPKATEPTSAFNPATRAAIMQVLMAAGDAEDLEARLAFVTDLAGRLRQIQADRQSDAQGRAARRRRGWGTGEPTLGPDTPERPRALVIDERVPLLDHDAGSNAALSHMRALQRIGYDVTFAPANLRGDGLHLAADGIGCCLHPWYGSIEEMLVRQRGVFSLVYLHRAAIAGRYANLVRAHQPKARLIYSVADLHHLRQARQAKVERRPELAALSAWTQKQELTTAHLVDAVITHSSFEAAVLRRHIEPARVHVVPWSVALRPTTVPLAERRGLAFIGGYGHRPNIAIGKVMFSATPPEVEAQGGPVPCLLVGSDMPEVLRGLGRHEVDPVGHVPDLAQVFDRVRLTVAPLAFGAGVKGKVLDSLAAGVPCVCTPAAAEGLDLPAILLDLVADTPEKLARSILALHGDAALNQACSEAGSAYIAANASEGRLDHLMRSAVGLKAVP